MVVSGETVVKRQELQFSAIIAGSPCGECGLWEPYDLVEDAEFYYRRPNGCVPWLCNDGQCPHEDRFDQDGNLLS